MLKNEKGNPMEWRDRKFLLDILNDLHPWQVVVKCTQVGLSTIEIFKTIFMAMVKKYGVIYTLPTYRLLTEFDKTKISLLLAQNPLIRPSRDNTLGVKSYDDGGYILFRGTMGDAQDISHSADLIVPDEADRSDLGVLEGLESRLQASEFQGQWWFTNPTRPNIGTDVKWQWSDKREWHVTCPHCELLQVLTYWDNVDKERKVFCCRVCRGEFDKEVRRKGRWIATNPGQKWHGYHISQLMAPWITAEHIIDSEGKGKEYFYNYVLGLPVIGEGVSVDRSLIMAAVVPKETPHPVGKQKFMGVDVGGSLHVKINDEHGGRKLICLTGKDKWDQLDKLMLRESINLCVIDNGPADGQVAFQRKHPYKVLRCIYDYNNKRKEDWEVDRDEGVIHVHRTRAIDAVLEAYGQHAYPIFLDEKDPLLDGTGKQGVIENCLTGHWSTLYLSGVEGEDTNIVKKDKMGNVIRTWENAGPDHFAHADIYSFVAMRAGGGSGKGTSFRVGDDQGRQARTREDEFANDVDKSSTTFWNT